MTLAGGRRLVYKGNAVVMLRWALEGKMLLLPDMPRMFDDWAADALARMRQAVAYGSTG